MRPASRIGLVLALVMGLALPAFAVDVYVNGERVTGVGNLTIQSPSSVRFDAQGNVFIDAPRYRVQAVIPAPAAGPAPRPATSVPEVRLSQTYFLVTDTNAPGHVQYDIAVSVNGQVVRRIEADEPQAIVNLNEFLRPGANAISIAAFKDLAGGRRGTSNGEVTRVLIGEGRDDGAGHVTLQTQSIVFVVDASQTDPVNRQYQLSVR